MTTRVCEYCFEYFATSSEILAHYRKAHTECAICDEMHPSSELCVAEEEGEE